MDKLNEIRVTNMLDVEELLNIFSDVKDSDAQKENKIGMLLEIRGVSVDKKPRKDGRWQGRINIDGTSKSVYGQSQQEVIYKLQEIINDKNKHKKQKTVYTLHTWLDKWVELYKSKLKPLSIVNIQNNISEIKKILPNKLITRLTGIEIQESLVKISTDYKRKRAFSKLAEAMEKAEQLNLIKKNPCSGVEPPKYKQKKKRALTPSEQELLLSAISGHKFEPLYYLMLTTGLRVGEALALTYGDITDGYVNVDKNVVFVGTNRIVQDTAKTEAGVRKVILPNSAFEKLKPLLNMDNSPLFPYHSKYVSKVFSEFCKNAGLNGYSLHSLRHTYSTRINEAGLPAKARQYLLGHANISVTENVYTDVQEEYIAAQKDLVNSVFDTYLTRKQ